MNYDKYVGDKQMNFVIEGFYTQLSDPFILGVQNIFDSYQDDFDLGVERDAGYIYGPLRPRTFFMGLRFGLD